MNIFFIITKSLRYLFAQRLRAISSLLGILFGVVAVVAMLSIGEGAKRESIEQIHLLGINNIIIKHVPLSEDQQSDKLSQGLSMEDTYQLATTPNVKHVLPVKIIEASVQGMLKDISPEILATSANYDKVYDLSLNEGRFLNQYDTDQRQLSCVLGHEVAKSLGKEGHVGKVIRIDNQLFKVVGVLSPRVWVDGKALPMSAHNLNQIIFIPIGADKGLPWRNMKERNRSLTEIVMQLHNGKDTMKASPLIERTLNLTHRGVEDYQIIIPQELIRQAQKTQHTFNLVLGSIACISLLVGGIGIMNIMLATISERTREIGIRRAVGANQSHILLQFLTETLILTLSGAILGIIVGMIFAGLISVLAGWKTIITLWSITLSLLLATGVGLFSGLYPAIKASRMHPINALRSY